jgi:hypothetical protein
MKDQTKEKIVLLTLNDNTKLEGVLIKIDKENLKIILGKGFITNTDGKTVTFEKTEIFKKDIREIRLVEEKEKPKEQERAQDPSNNNEINKNSQNTNNTVNKTDDKTEDLGKGDTFNAIPQNIQERYQNSSSKYEKDDFFDGLTISNNKENYKEIRTYNEKNKETFALDDTFLDNGNKIGQKNYNYRKRRGGNRGGRGGYQGGGYHGHRGGYGGHRGGYGQGFSNNNNNNSNYQGNNNTSNIKQYNNNNNYQGNNNNNNNNYQGNNNNYNKFNPGNYGNNNNNNSNYHGNNNSSYHGNNNNNNHRGGYDNNNHRGGYDNHSSHQSNQFGVKSDMSVYSGNTGYTGKEHSVYDK